MKHIKGDPELTESVHAAILESRWRRAERNDVWERELDRREAIHAAGRAFLRDASACLARLADSPHNPGC
jgi:hypothetical protein